MNNVINHPMSRCFIGHGWIVGGPEKRKKKKEIASRTAFPLGQRNQNKTKNKNAQETVSPGHPLSLIVPLSPSPWLAGTWGAYMRVVLVAVPPIFPLHSSLLIPRSSLVFSSHRVALSSPPPVPTLHSWGCCVVAARHPSPPHCSLFTIRISVDVSSL